MRYNRRSFGSVPACLSPWRRGAGQELERGCRSHPLRRSCYPSSRRSGHARRLPFDGTGIELRAYFGPETENQREKTQELW